MASAYIRDTKVIGCRTPRPVAKLVEEAAEREGATVSDFVFSCIEPNLDQAALRTAQRQVANDREAVELAAQ